MFYSFVRGYVR